MMNNITMRIQPTRHLRKILLLIMLFSVTFLFTACGETEEAPGVSDAINTGSSKNIVQSDDTNTIGIEDSDSEKLKQADSGPDSADAQDDVKTDGVTENTQSQDTLNNQSDGVTASVTEQSAEPNTEQLAETAEEAGQYSPFPFTFTTKDLYGNTVTEESLGDKRLFFIHYWATWCGPCIQEMPELAKIAKNYEDNVGFIALVGDYGSNLSGAQHLTESVGIPSSFIMVDAEVKDMETLLSLVQTGYIPTTAIIDGNGKLLAESPLIGAYGEGYAEILDSLLE